MLWEKVSVAGEWVFHEDIKAGAEIFFKNSRRWTLFVLLETATSLLTGCFWLTNQESPMLVNFFKMEIYRFFWCNYHVNVNSILNYGPGVIRSFSVYTFTLLKLFLNERWHLFSGQRNRGTCRLRKSCSHSAHKGDYNYCS